MSFFLSHRLNDVVTYRAISGRGGAGDPAFAEGVQMNARVEGGNGIRPGDKEPMFEVFLDQEVKAGGELTIPGYDKPFQIRKVERIESLASGSVLWQVEL